MTTPTARLTAFRDHILATTPTMNASRFEQSCGLANGFFKAHQNKNPYGLTVASLAKVKSAYPILNTDWVITGEGTMLIAPSGIPLYDADFKAIVPAASPAGIIGITPASYITLPPSTPSPTFACRANEPSMQPAIPQNAVIALAPIQKAALTPSIYGKPIAVILSDGSHLIRHLAATTKTTVTMTPTTPSHIHQPFTIKKASITHLFQICAYLSTI